MNKYLTFFFTAVIFLACAPVFAQMPATVTGRVIDAADGKPIAGATITFDGTQISTVTDAEGRFAVLAKVGTIIYFTFEEYTLESHTVSKEGRYDTGDIVLVYAEDLLPDDAGDPGRKPAAQALSTVTGRIIDAVDGKPLQGTDVTVSGTRKYVTTGAGGRFVIEAEAGATVWFTLAGYRATPLIVLKEDGHNLGDIALDREVISSGVKPEPASLPTFAQTQSTAKEELQASIAPLPAALPAFVQRKATVTGRVISAANGEPIAGVTAGVPAKTGADITGITGHFYVEAEVGETIYFSIPGRKTVSRIVSKAGRYDTGDITLEEVASIHQSGQVMPEDSLIAQGTVTVTGRVTDIISGQPLPGAAVKVLETETGTATGIDGNFSIEAAAGATIQISYVGYGTYTTLLPAALPTAGVGRVTVLAALEENALALSDVTVTSTVAIARKTPVAVSTVGKNFIYERIGGQDFPEVLRHTPGVYATRKGGGFGDSELRLRGFKQENVAVMVNGVPMNDMEHGGVYWSNWAGLADVAQSVQVQRGLGAAKVSAPSVGGSVNIITAGIETERGGFASYEAGDNGFNKITFKVSSGLNDRGWAMTLLGGKSWGEGYVQGTEFESYNWFVNVAKRINERHRISLTAFGAPQWHNQRNRNDGLTLDWWKQVQQYMGEKSAYRYNPSYGFGIGGERKTSSRNVYHKPQISINHLWTISEKSSLSSVLYRSMGRGYGYSGQGNLRNRWYGTYNGELNLGQFRHADGTFAYDVIYDINTQSNTGAQMAMSKSVNEHDWMGLISTFTTKFGERFDFYGGIDLRSYAGMHNNVLIDNYGAEYFLDSYARSQVRPENNAAASAGSEWINRRLYPGDTVYRDYSSNIGQMGVFAQAEYSYDRLSAFVAGSVSNTSYRRFDRFYYDEEHALSTIEQFIGFTAKGGANYNLGDRNNVFANIGYISRAPFFSGGVFLSADVSNVTNPDAVNEKIFSMELGYGFTSRLFNLKLNAYRTVWSDKTMTKLTFVGNDYITLNMAGVKAKHEGIELDMAASPLSWLDVTGMLSLGWWRWMDAATGYFYTSTGQPVASVSGQTIELADGIGAANHASTTLELDGVKVGGAAQTTASLGVKVKPLKGLYIGVDYLLYDRNYADWSFAAADLSYNGTKKYETPWRMPAVDLFDLSAGYSFKVGGLDATLSGNIFNLYDTDYIADATDGAEHNASTAYGIFYGFGRTGSVKLRITF